LIFVVASFIAMKIFAKKLQEQLQTALNGVDLKSDTIKGCDHRIDLVEGSIKELKQYITEHPFPDKAAEIYYYKHIAPSFYQLFFLFKLLYRLELERIILDEKGFQLFLKRELKKACKFLKKYIELYKYFYSTEDYWDESLFTRKKGLKYEDVLSIDMDDHYCPDSRLLSRILACLQYKDFMERELKDEVFSPKSQEEDPVECKATKSDGAEFAAAVYEAKIMYINGKPFSLAQVVKRVEQFFNIDLKDFSILDNVNRSRKKTPAFFLGRLTSNYIKRKDRLDEEQFKNR
jgi:hypothetical protein